MKNLMKRMSGRDCRGSLLRDERGLSTVEYVILLVLIAASCIGLWMKLGESIKSRIDGSRNEIEKNVNIDNKGTK